MFALVWGAHEIGDGVLQSLNLVLQVSFSLSSLCWIPPQLSRHGPQCKVNVTLKMTALTSLTQPSSVLPSCQAEILPINGFPSLPSSYTTFCADSAAKKCANSTKASYHRVRTGQERPFPICESGNKRSVQNLHTPRSAVSPQIHGMPAAKTNPKQISFTLSLYHFTFETSS